MAVPAIVRTLNPGLEGTDAGGTTTTFNLAADPVAGQSFFLPLCAYTSGILTSVSIGGTAATRKTPTTNAYDATNHTTIEGWAVENHPGGTNRAVVVTYGSANTANGGNYLLCDVITLDGGVVDIGPALAIATGTSTAPAIVSGTLGAADEFLCAWVNLRNQDATITQPSGWTSLVNVGTWSSTEAGAIAHKTVTGSNASQTATWTFAPSSLWSAILVTWKAASSTPIGTGTSTLSSFTSSGAGGTGAGGAGTSSMSSFTSAGSAGAGVGGTGAGALSPFTSSGAGGAAKAGAGTSTLSSFKASGTVPFLNIWCHGNSNASYPGGGQAWPDYLAALRPSATVSTRSVGAVSTVDLKNEFAAQIHPNFIAGATNLVILDEILDDINDFGATASTAYSHVADYVTVAEGLGWVVIVGTCPDTVEFSVNDAGPDLGPYRRGCNALLRVDFAGAAGLADWAVHPRLGDEGAALNSTYFDQPAGIHIKAPGQSLKATIADWAIKKYLESQTEPVGTGTLQPLTSSGAGGAAKAGAGAGTLQPLTSSGSAGLGTGGTGTSTISALSSSGTGGAGTGGVGASALQPLSSLGGVTDGGVGASTLASLTSSGTGGAGTGGSGASALQPLASAGVLSDGGAGTGVLQPVTSSGTGGAGTGGVGASALQPLSSAGAAGVAAGGTGTSALQPLASLGSMLAPIGAATSTLSPFASSGTGGAIVYGVGASTLSALTSSGTATPAVGGSANSSMAPLSSSGIAGPGQGGAGQSACSPFTSSGIAGAIAFGAGVSSCSPFTSSGIATLASGGTGGSSLSPFATWSAAASGSLASFTSVGELSFFVQTVVRVSAVITYAPTPTAVIVAAES